MCYFRDVLLKNPFFSFSLQNVHVLQTYRKKPVKKETEELPAGKEVKNGFSKAYFTAANGVMNKKTQ